MSLLASGCAEPPGYDLRRASFIAGDDERAAVRPVEILVAGGVSRPGLRLAEDEERAVARLDRLTAGRLMVNLAPDAKAPDGGSARVSLRETGWRARVGLGLEAACHLQWGAPGTPTETPWQTCLLDLPRPLASAIVVVERGADATGDLLVADLRLEGNVRSTRPPVFVLVVDAARFDKLRPFAADVPFGDHFEALARDSVVLDELRSATSWTRPSVATLFTGLRADRHRVHERSDKLAEGLVTVPELLRGAGYATWGWSANPNVLPVWGFGQGFDALVDQGGLAWARSKTDGAEMLGRLRAALASRGPEAGLYFLHLMDPHGPYLPSEEQQRIVDALPDAISLFPRPLAALGRPQEWAAFRNYLGELLDTDDHIGAFVKMLRDEGLYDESLVMVVADHGEEFLDHGGRDHGRTLYEEVLRVPCLIKLPGNRNGGRIFEAPVSFEDLAPTLLDALGVEVPAGLDGRVIPLATDDGFPARPHVATLHLDGRRQRTIVDPPWKLIHYDGTGATELFHLEDDPRERRNLAGSEPEVQARLETGLRAVLERSEQGWHVLVCGTMEATRLDLSLRAPGVRASFYGFDAGEAVAVEHEDPRAAPEAWRLRPVLTPIRIPRETLVRASDLILARQPQAVLMPQAAAVESILEVASSGGEPLRYRLGSSDALAQTREIRLRSMQEEVLADPTARMECSEAGASPVDGAEPFVRIWFVPPVESLTDEEIDPELRERLRTLGYLH